MLDVTTEELQSILLQLDQAIYNHDQWSKALDRTLICRTAGDERDMAKDAHRRCRFGQWYYNHSPAALRSYPAFVAIGADHQRMHEFAASLLRASGLGASVSVQEFDIFANALERLRLQVQTLKRELTELLYTRDPLTGASSRLGLMTALREQRELAIRGIQTCCIAMMDIDRFKLINDSYGHPAGDKALAAVAGHVMRNMRPYDKLFRYGGEEFVICLPGMGADAAFDAIERLRKGVEGSSIAYDGKQISVTASFGIVVLEPESTVEQSVDRADKALLAAKSAGRNCTRLWDPSM